MKKYEILDRIPTEASEALKARHEVKTMHLALEAVGFILRGAATTA